MGDTRGLAKAESMRYGQLMSQHLLPMPPLVALAQIAGDPAFEHHWRTARDEARLRDVLLLTERKRVCAVPSGAKP